MARRSEIQTQTWQKRRWTGTVNVYDSFSNSVMSYSDLVVDTNNQPLHLGSGDQGGPFTVYHSSDVSDFAVMPSNNWEWRGQFKPGNPPAHLVGWGGSPSYATQSQMEVIGTTGMARSAPTNPSFQLSTALGELASDGLPAVSGMSLLKERVKLARSAGGEYLNVQFGWLPLVNDLRLFAKTVKDSEAILDQYRKDADKKIRRRYMFPPSRDSVYYTGTGFQSYPLAYSGPGHYYGETEERKWFSGAFRYHIPTSDTQLGKFRQWASLSDRLLGWKITPETVWNIAPWSWAVDWFTNAGDVMTNISNLGGDGLVMQYGYAMSHKRRVIRYGMTIQSDYDRPRTCSRVITTDIKQRIHAHPYGFGVTGASLSAKQLSIMAALGLSKV